MKEARRILLVASLVVVGLSGTANASMWRSRKTQPQTEAATATVMQLASLDVDGSRVVLHTSGTPAYTSYSPSADVFIVDLTATSRPATLLIPSTLPAGVTSIAAQEVVEMGNRLTRVTFRLAQPMTLQASAEEKSVVVTLPAMAAAETPAPAVQALAPVETPHVETVAESAPAVTAPAEPKVETIAQPPAAAPVISEPAPVPSVAAKAVKTIEATGDAEVLIGGDGALKYKSFKLDNPARIVVDIAGTNNAVVQKTVNVDGTLVKRVRVAQFQGAPNPITRVVIDLGAKTTYTVTPDGPALRVTFGNAPMVAKAAPAPAPPVEQTPAPKPAVATVSVVEPAPAATKPAASTDIPSQVPVIAENASTWKMPEPASKGARKVINAPAAQNPPKSGATRTTAAGATGAARQAASSAQSTNSEDVFDNDQQPQQPATTPSTIGNTAAPAPATSSPTLGGTLSTSGRTLSGAGRQFTGEPISLNLKDADIKDVLRTFAQLTGLNIAVDPGVQGSVTVDFVDVPWDQALDLILRQNGLTFVLEGNVMRIGTIGRLSDEAAAQAVLAEKERLNVPLTTLSFQLSYARSQEVALLLAAIASPRARIIVDQRTNQLIISEIPQYLQTMRNLIETVDIPARQVVIEARIVETSKVFQQQYGFNWGFNGVLDPALGNGTGLVFPNRAGLTGGPFNFGGGLPVLALTLSDVLGTFSLDFALTAFEQEGYIKVISAPRVTTQDNTPAEIQSGFQIPYQTRINFTTTVQYLDATLRLSVTPQITQSGTVIMEIQVQKNEPATGLAIEGAAGTPLTTRQARTRLMVRDGGTAVIAGIYQTKDNNGQSRLPFVHQIPVIGNLFKSHNISTSHDELLIFITPRIVRG